MDAERFCAESRARSSSSSYSRCSGSSTPRCSFHPGPPMAHRRGKPCGRWAPRRQLTTPPIRRPRTRTRTPMRMHPTPTRWTASRGWPGPTPPPPPGGPSPLSSPGPHHQARRHAAAPRGGHRSLRGRQRPSGGRHRGGPPGARGGRPVPWPPLVQASWASVVLDHSHGPFLRCFKLEGRNGAHSSGDCCPPFGVYHFVGGPWGDVWGDVSLSAGTRRCGSVGPEGRRRGGGEGASPRAFRLRGDLQAAAPGDPSLWEAIAAWAAPCPAHTTHLLVLHQARPGPAGHHHRQGGWAHTAHCTPHTAFRPPVRPTPSLPSWSGRPAPGPHRAVGRVRGAVRRTGVRPPGDHGPGRRVRGPRAPPPARGTASPAGNNKRP